MLPNDEDNKIIQKFLKDASWMNYNDSYEQIFRIIDKLESLKFEINYHKCLLNYHIHIYHDSVSGGFSYICHDRKEALYQCCLKVVKYLNEHK